MFKKILAITLFAFITFSCAKIDNVEVEPTNEELAVTVYAEAVTALKKGDAFYAAKKFKEVESLLPQTEWAAKASLLAAYADYTRNAYVQSIFAFERHINNYPADKNIPYAHFLIAICYYEQILDEKKDLKPLLKSKEKFEFIVSEFPDTDYATDSRFKLDLIEDQLAAKEMSIARYYMQTEKWIPALNRLKLVVDKYDRTVFIEEALHRLVEVYYKIGLVDEAKKAASILGYNYASSAWYEQSYKVFNKKYRPIKLRDEKKELGLVRRTIKKLF
mgnify:CR=1 FL=1|tara:strand:+ start:1942 stop:2766 length:825 start_codon:yes stop_codon:yes gene_type:complete